MSEEDEDPQEKDLPLCESCGEPAEELVPCEDCGLQLCPSCHGGHECDEEF